MRNPIAVTVWILLRWLVGVVHLSVSRKPLWDGSCGLIALPPTNPSEGVAVGRDYAALVLRSREDLLEGIEHEDGGTRGAATARPVPAASKMGAVNKDMRIYGPEPSVRSFFDLDERLALNKRSSGHADFREDPTDILNVSCEDPGEAYLDDCLSDAGRLHTVALEDRCLKRPSHGSRAPSTTSPRGLRAFACNAPMDGRCGSRCARDARQ